MPDCLHPMLLLLTLLDLAFVGVTGVVPGSGLAPLLLLASVSPFLRRLQRYRAYRVIWNTSVLVVFSVLVHHATTTGLLHMLEDGLLLAVLCQVHLLNNVGNRQRPDLVFFNSFLIAFVTSFFATGTAWSVLFVIHAVVFVPALELNVIARRNGTIGWPVARLLLRDSLPRTAAIGLTTALVFVFCPRDFQHQGWLGDALAQHAGRKTGLSDVIRLDDDRPIQLSDAVVMRITTGTSSSAGVPSHWRGMVYQTFDGHSWQSRPGAITSHSWQRLLDGRWRRPTRQLPVELHVQLVAPSHERLLLPLAACEVQQLASEGVMLGPRPSGEFGYLRTTDAPRSPIDYMVRVGTTSDNPAVPAGATKALLQLPWRSVARTAQQLAQPLRQQLPADASHAAIARHLANWLRRNRRYQLPGGPGFAGSVAAFAIGSGAGHCEYFATMLALMLRSQGVPCRLAAGYLAQELADDGSVVVRSKHAHAWVEALLPDGLWITVDATPPQDNSDTDGSDGSWWHSISSELDGLWSSVLGFDESGRARLFVAIGALPATLGALAIAYPLGTTGLLALPIAWLYVRRQRRRQPFVIAALLAAARAAGLVLQPGETPRELLARARTADIPGNRIEVLADAVQQHERTRYGTAEP